MAVPANVSYLVQVQDDHGFRANVRINCFDSDLTQGVPNLGETVLSSFVTMLTTPTTGIFATLQALTNAKVVRQAMVLEFNYAQEPTTETGTYQLVTQKARLDFGDGAGGFAHIEIPAPVDALFYSAGSPADQLRVVNPSATVLSNLRTALAQTTAQGAVGAATVGPITHTPRGGVYGSQFFGGQFVNAKPPVRRVLQGA